MDKREIEFVNERFLRPRNSPVSGLMVASIEKWYGVPPVWFLTVIGAETAMAHGNPEIGGKLVRYNNFGCIKYTRSAAKKPWGILSNGTVRVGGEVWFTFPDEWTGIAALGRLLKTVYKKYIDKNDYAGFTAHYYGKRVPGYEAYHRRWIEIFNWCQAEARKAGFAW